MNKLKKVVFNATGRDIHIDVPLSNVALDYRPVGMIADMIMPVVGVPNISGSIPEFSRGDMLRVEEDLRAPGTMANVVTRDVSSDNFVCTGRALARVIPIEDRANADAIYVQKLFNGAAEFVTGKLHLGWERRVARQVTSGSNVGSYSAVGSSWTDHSNSDPLADIQTALDNVQDSTGVRPNRVTVGDTAWRHIRRNVTVRDLIFGVNNGGGYPSADQLASLLDVEEVLIGRSYENTANEGQAESLSQIWDDNVLVHYTPQAASKDTPSFAYTLRWEAQGIPNMQVERHAFNTETKSEKIEVGYSQTEKITGADYGFLLTAVTSST